MQGVLVGSQWGQVMPKVRCQGKISSDPIRQLMLLASVHSSR